MVLACGAPAAAAAAVVIAAVHGLPPSSPSTPAAGSNAARPASAFPASPPSAVVFGHAAGLGALGLAIVPGKATFGLQASVVGPGGSGVEHLAVRFVITAVEGGSSIVAATSCGPGCYRGTATAAVARPARVAVVYGRRSAKRVAFSLPVAWPPPAGALVARAARVWRSLRSLVDHDSLSDGRVSGTTVWKIVAPDRIEYETPQGGDSVIIGNRRWDKPSGPGPWQESSQVPIRQPVPDWDKAVDARLLGTVSIQGKPAWKISFFDPTTPAWFSILVDEATLHTVDVRMIATGHFMHDVYGSFNTPIRITPPRSEAQP